ncbi:mediator of RNA polymerase II transcription subunit 19a isoform X1 [Cajanus cajan]|uniref:mediator of RNA polymerase II transcription subunit 19a isoform X1 n=1 Tax=Cajanus cajan TaxID=3821 RepID=UPI00098DCC57|nr:mediator of RNA polymerase II transcription subunit 19a isoform X1 [Cajanus cajan]XP_020229165.1 mediator of RNA polymerase II transcription subunit 19a isoform X1 [Cajanus cajan]XP_029129570.1 mediator of RNA polymerase II transcription subunit 19a isoform X1 [Cajanus cajan]
MDPESKKFGGPRELTGSVDLLNHFKLLPHFEFFCKRPLPVSISDAHYLHNIVGDTEIRKGDGMQLDQLIQNSSLSSGTNYRIQPLDFDILKEAFQLKENAPIDLPAAEKGIPTVAGKSKGESKDEKKHKKHKDRDKDKDKEHRKHKHRQKDRSQDKEKDKKKDKSRHNDSSADPSKKHHEKKRKHVGDDDLTNVHKHKKSKHKSSKIDELGAIKVAG